LGSSTSKPAATLADCKTADGQGVVKMLVNVTLLSKCNETFVGALLPVVEQVVAELAGSSNGVAFDVKAGSCATRIRVRYAEALQL
jgi:hypothetical protein